MSPEIEAALATAKGMRELGEAVKAAGWLVFFGLWVNAWGRP